MTDVREIFDLYQYWGKGVLNYSGLDIDKAKEAYQNTGVVTLENIIKDDIAHKHHSFLHDMPDWWWKHTVVYWDNDRVNKWLDNTEENQSAIIQERLKANNTLLRGVFAYSYKRTVEGDHFDLCKCGLCDFNENFYKELGYLLEYITGKPVVKGETFSAYYQEGDFNGLHHDQNKGECAFVLHLSKGWRPDYGGVFYSLSDDGETIETATGPTFNKLVLLNVDKPGGKNHLVTHINVPNFKRFSISGWYESN